MLFRSRVDGSPRYPSRFLLDVDPGLLEFTEPPRDRLIAETREYVALSEKYLPEDPAAGRFRPGDRVRHQFLGDGTVVEVDWTREAHIVRFDGIPTPRSISFRVTLTGIE